MPAPKMKSTLLNENPHYCSLCNLDLSSEITALTHYQGENHAKNLRKRQAGTLPNVRGFGIGMAFKRDQNNAGSKRKSDDEAGHCLAAKIAKGEGEEDNSEVEIVKVESNSGQKVRTYCTTCKKECNTRDEYKIHMMSTAHAAQAALAPSTSYLPDKPPKIMNTPGSTKPGK